MASKDGRDWLDIASGDAATKKANPKAAATANEDRPRSEGSIRDKAVENKRSETANSEPVDWLGLSRLGSPDTNPKAGGAQAEQSSDYLGIGYDEPESKQPLKSALKTPPPKEDQADDWLGIGSSNRRSNQPGRRTETATSRDSDIADDWLGLSDSKGKGQADDRLGVKSDKMPSRETKKVDDWLGSRDKRSNKGDDWLGVKDAKADQKDDWLGGRDVKTDKKDDWLGTGDSKATKESGVSQAYLDLGPDIDPDGILR